MVEKNFISKCKETLTIGITVEVSREQDYYIAYCPALEVSSYGKDIKTAKKRFLEEVEIFFIETERKGSLEKYLLKMGWTLSSVPVPNYIPPPISDKNFNKENEFFTEKIAIPIC